MKRLLSLGLSVVPGASLGVKALILVGGLLTLTALYAAWHHHVWRNGYEDAITAIAEQDKKAIAVAQKRRSLVRDCAADGLRWDQSTGKCVGR